MKSLRFPEAFFCAHESLPLMNHKLSAMIRTALLISFFGLGAFCAQSQSISPEVIGSSGEHFSNANASISWTIGEPVITTETGTNAIVTQGFHQPEYQIGVTVPESHPASVEVQLYPNPSQGQVQLTFEKNDFPMQLRLMGLKGELIYEATVPENTTNMLLDLTTYERSTYLLNLFSKDEAFNTTYKIQKVN
jgi:hypothetical protein